MAFVGPTFNLSVNIWRAGNPTSNPPDVVSLCNLALGRRAGTLKPYSSTTTPEGGGMWLLLPAGTDIQDFKNGGSGDTVEVGAGTGRYYLVTWVDDAGGGFPNEHRFAEIVGISPWPTPFPRAGAGYPPPPTNAVSLGAQVAQVPVMPPTATFPFGAGAAWIVSFGAGPGFTMGTLTSTTLGALAPLATYTGPAIGGSISQMNLYLVSYGAPVSDLLTQGWIGTVGIIGITAVQWGTPWSTLDTTGLASGALGYVGTPASSVARGSGNEVVSCFLLGANDPADVFGVAWSGLPLVGNPTAAGPDTNGNSWCCSIQAYSVVAGATPLSACVVTGWTNTPNWVCALKGVKSP